MTNIDQKDRVQLEFESEAAVLIAQTDPLNCEAAPQLKCPTYFYSVFGQKNENKKRPGMARILKTVKVMSSFGGEKCFLFSLECLNKHFCPVLKGWGNISPYHTYISYKTLMVFVYANLSSSFYSPNVAFEKKLPKTKVVEFRKIWSH